VIVGSAIVDIVEKTLGDTMAMEKDLRQYVARMNKATGH
jgi:tryptophan synthase alpha subunit